MKSLALCLLFLLIPFSLAVPLSAQEKGVTPVGATARVAPTGVTRAVVIGISDYQDKDIPDLRFADRDAEAFVVWLQSPAGGNVPSENIMLLANKQATVGKMTAAIDGLLETCHKGDLVIIYFSGHGDVETRTVRNLGFLLTYDSPANSYIAGAYPIYYLQSVMETLAERGVKIIMVADACHAGKLAGSGISGSEATVQNLARQFANEVKIMSCQPNEFSLEGEQWGGGRGVFSFHLMEGLYGLADMNEDKEVTLREIGRYLEDQVPLETAPQRQTPYTTGDPYHTIATVDKETLTALRKKKAAELPGFDQVEIKGLADVLLAAKDSNIQVLYRQFAAAMELGDLLEPQGNSAYDFFLAMPSIDSLLPLRNLMRRNLAAALQDDAQQAINSYLRSDTAEIYARFQKDKRYAQYPFYLEKAADLLGAEHYAYRNIMCKKHYFDGIIRLLYSVDPNKKDSLRKESILSFKKALEYEDRAAYVYLALGESYFLYDAQQCIAYCDEAIELAPDWAMPWWQKGLCYQWARQYEMAEACFLRALQFDTTFAMLYYNIGNLYQFNMGKPEKAEVMYARFFALDSTNCSVGVYLSICLAQIQAYYRKNIQDGIFTMQRSIHRCPDFWMAYNMLGRLHEHKGEMELAEAAYEKAYLLNPADGAVDLILFKLLIGYTDEAEALSQKMLQIDSTQAFLWQILAHIYTRTKRYDKAEAILAKAFSIDSLNTSVLEELGYLYYRRGDISEASRLCRKAVSLDVMHGWASMYLAFICYRQGKTDEAFEWLEKSIQIDTPYSLLSRFPDLAPLRTLPEWKTLMKKHFPEQVKD